MPFLTLLKTIPQPHWTESNWLTDRELIYMLYTNQWCLRALICVSFISTVGARVYLTESVMSLTPLSFDSFIKSCDKANQTNAF